MKSFLINRRRKRVIGAVIMAACIALSSLYIIPSNIDVYADDTTETTDTDKAAEKAFTPKTGVVAFWEWERINSGNIREKLSDNKFHPVIFAGTKTINGNHPFLSSYSDRDHCFLPTNTDSWNQYKEYFKSVPNNPETENSYEGHYGKKSNEEHSTSYYFNATSSVYYCGTNVGQNGVSDIDYNSSKFFTTGNSMGVPWIKVAKWGSDYGRTIISFTFPQKQLTNTEAVLYQPKNNSDWFLQACSTKNGEARDEPANYLVRNMDDCINGHTHDGYHLVFSGENTYLITYNNDYDNDVCKDNFGSNVINGDTDYSYLCLMSNTERKYNIIPQGSESSPCYNRSTMNYCYHAFIGTPHFFTAFMTQTIGQDQFFPISAAGFKDDDGMDAKSEGMMIPKGETITIDGGIVSLSTNLINNGNIVIKNGGSLVIKNGGCVGPYTKQAQGNITVEDGNVIIMPGGKLCCFENNNGTQLTLTKGSSIVNYGYLAATKISMAEGCKIENRKNGVFYAGLERKDPLTFMHTQKFSSSSIGNTQYTTKGYTIDNINQLTANNIYNKITDFDSAYGVIFDSWSWTKFSDCYRVDLNLLVGGSGWYSFYVYDVSDQDALKKKIYDESLAEFVNRYKFNVSEPTVGIIGVKCQPTIINEKTAKFNYKNGSKNFANDAIITTPTY